VQRTIAILPVKSFGAAKQRLGGLVEPEARSILARAMLADVLAALTEVPAIEEVAIVTANSLAEDLSVKPRVRVLSDGHENGQSAAALIGINHARQQGFGRALLVPGDAPLLDPAEVSALLGHTESLVIVPDRHGAGTNGLLMSPVGVIEPAFGPGSRTRHEARARAAGVGYAIDPLPSLILDVDTPYDLEAITRALEARGGAAPATREALRRLSLTPAS